MNRPCPHTHIATCVCVYPAGEGVCPPAPLLRANRKRAACVCSQTHALTHVRSFDLFCTGIKQYTLPSGTRQECVQIDPHSGGGVCV